MLEVFRDFEISGEQSKLTKFVSQFIKAMPQGWERDTKREKELHKSSSDGRHFAFKIEARNERPSANLFIFRLGHTLKVTNIVPVEMGELSRAQYNSYLEDFNRVATPIAQKLGLNPRVTSGQQDIRDLLSTDAFSALKAFSAGANKTTGSSHPLDRRRWVTFLLTEHTSDSRLDSNLLERWLIEEEKWPETEARDLAIEFEFSRELLTAYDEEHA